jgi:hypothetical protein
LDVSFPHIFGGCKLIYILESLAILVTHPHQQFMTAGFLRFLAASAASAWSKKKEVGAPLELLTTTLFLS